MSRISCADVAIYAGAMAGLGWFRSRTLVTRKQFFENRGAPSATDTCTSRRPPHRSGFGLVGLRHDGFAPDRPEANLQE
jgi:hypothetical protein